MTHKGTSVPSNCLQQIKAIIWNKLQWDVVGTIKIKFLMGWNVNFAPVFHTSLTSAAIGNAISASSLVTSAHSNDLIR